MKPMDDEKDALPSDQEDGSLKPMKPNDEKPNERRPSPDGQKVEQDPSEQPS